MEWFHAKPTMQQTRLSTAWRPWHSPCGMTMPEIYVDPGSPRIAITNELKEKGIVFDDLSRRCQMIKSNLSLMYGEMVRRSKKATSFHGWEVGLASCFGRPSGHPLTKTWGISILPGETRCSTLITPMLIECGTLPGKKRRDFSDRDWFDSSYLFYDEKKTLVRAKVWQFLDTQTLGYGYQNVDIPWLRSRPTPRRRRRAKVAEIVDTRNAFPLVLDKLVRIKVPRPKRSMTKVGEEVLVIENIQGEENIEVSLVPKEEKCLVSIGNIKTDYIRD
ncbi:hypothetical protein GQ457_09G008300 [Hibiscus cannabinus]